MIESILLWLFALLTAPLFAGIVFKVKAFFGGRKGSPVLINYYTLIKLFKKGSVYSTSTTFIFKLGPMVSLGASATSLLFLPIAGHFPVFSFNGDVIFILYLMGLARFFTIAAAMDTASPFEGMGAAREAYFPIICEASMFMILILFLPVDRRSEFCRLLFRWSALRPLADRRIADPLRGHRFLHHTAHRKRPGAGGRSGHAPGIDHDPRGDGSGPQWS